MKLCANISLLFTEEALPERFAAAREQGFHAVEIQFPYSHDLHLLLDKQQEAAMKIALINLPAGNLLDDDLGLACSPNRVDEFKRAVDQGLNYAYGLNVDCVNVLAGRCAEAKRFHYCYDTYLRNLEYAADQLRDIGVRAVFEAINTYDVPDFLLHSSAHMQQVVRDLNHANVAMQYDFYHMSRMGEAIGKQLPDLITDIGHIQFADTPNRQQPGTGDLPLAELLQQLRELGYRHWIGAEYQPSAHTADSLEWMTYFDSGAL